MAKDPAFLFYSQDWLVGTATMTFEDRGKYITIIAQMHQEGRMNEETIRFLVGSVSDKLKSKFRIDENGLWYNERLESESDKRASFTESRRKNGKKGGRPKANGKPKKNLEVNHMDNHMGNEDVNDNEDVNKGGIRGDHSKVDVVLPFDSGKFKKAWHEWKQHLIDQGKFYKGFHSEQADLKILAEFANGSETIAINVIYNAIAKQWKNLNVELFKPTNGTSKPKNRNR